MKNIKLITIILICFLSIQCKAQSEIRDLTDSRLNATTNTYINDNNNLLDPFVGTWVLDDGINYLKIVFQKKIMLFTGGYHEDILIGEIQYKVNGQEIINTLDKLNEPNTFPENRNHTIEGNYIWTNQTPFDEYTSDNFRIGLIMVEPNGASTNIDVRITIVNGQEAIQIFKREGIKTKKENEADPPESIIPNGFQYLIKQ